LSNQAQSGHVAAPGTGAAGFLSGIFGGDSRALPMSPQSTQPKVQTTAFGSGRVELRPDRGGQYHAEVEIEGRRIPMLVDTGATLVSLTFADAQRLGLAPAPSDYKFDVSTANGIAKAARVSLREVRVENLAVRDVAALVMPQNVTGTSLLGMSFLQRLGGFEVASGNLVLRP
jgi:aspartyl protease family protein